MARGSARKRLLALDYASRVIPARLQTIGVNKYGPPISFDDATVSGLLEYGREVVKQGFVAVHDFDFETIEDRAAFQRNRRRSGLS